MSALAMRISDFIEASNAARTPEDLFQAFGGAVKSYGYDRYMYSMITNDPLCRWRNVPSTIQNYPEHWMSFYIEKGYMAIDPLKQIAYRARRPVLWDDVPKLIELTQEQKNCLEQGTESGLYNGIGIPFHGPYGEVAGLGLASSERNIELTPAIVSTLGLIASQFHAAHIGMVLGELAHSPDCLTPREKEVLHWCALGKSNWTIGEILDVSEHAVKFHVANCIAKLGADSRITAVLKAIRLGLIHP
jgi:DNA-binding CsgD family transcriptional regulator